MRSLLLIAGFAAAASFSATQSAAQDLPTRPNTDAPAITISCFRGPWREVIWDKPNAVFLDGLTRIGYSPAQAYAIGRRVCRDEYGLKDPEYLKSTFRRLIAEKPPAG